MRVYFARLGGVACCTFVLAHVSLAQTETGEVVGDFDSTSNANTVDDIVQQGGGTQTVGGWEAAVEAAFAAATGGVWNSGISSVASRTDAAGAGTTSFTTAELNVPFGDQLSITFSTTVTTINFGSSTQTSGFRNISSSSQTSTGYTATFATTGLSVVSEFGLVYLGRAAGGSGSPGDLTITASLDDASTIALVTPDPLNGNTEDTLFYFVAPTGRYFTGFSYASTTARENPFDDFGFVFTAIPEPASLALLTGGLGLLVTRRTRR